MDFSTKIRAFFESASPLTANDLLIHVALANEN